MLKLLLRSFSIFALLSIAKAQVVSVEHYSDSVPPAVYYSQQDSKAPMMLGLLGNRMTFSYQGESKTLDDETEQTGGKHAKLLRSGNNLYALWWVKLENTQKKLYFRASRDLGKTWEALQTINSGEDFQVLGHFEMVSPAPEQVAIIYYDERTGYGIYVNRSLDGGRTWLKRDILLSTLGEKADIDTTTEVLKTLTQKDEAKLQEDEKSKKMTPDQEKEQVLANLKKPRIFALEPHIYSIGDKQLVAIWKEFVPRKNIDVLYQRLTERLRQDKRYTHQVMIRMAYSKDFGENWQVSTVYESKYAEDTLPISLSFMQQNDKWWIGAHLEQGIALFSSVDQGKTWQALSLKENDSNIQSFDGARFVLTADSIWAVYSNYYGGRVSASYVTRFDFVTQQWVKPSPLFLVEGEAEAISLSDNALIAALSPKEVVIAWNELAFVTPKVMLAYYVLDAEKGWFMQDQKILDWSEGVKAQYILSLDKFGESEAMISVKNSMRYGAEIFNQLNYFIRASNSEGLKGDGLKELPVKIDLDQRKQALIEALNTFWQARVNEDDGVAYKLMDPYYRQQNSLRNFIAGQSNFDYQGYEVQDVAIDALGYRAIATVELEYTLEQRADATTGQKAETVVAKELTKQNWVYIDGEWFMEVRLGVGSNSFIK